MPVYYTTGFDGKWPVGTAAVVQAGNETEAAEKLNAELAKRGLETPQTFTLTKLKPGHAVILNDGDY